MLKNFCYKNPIYREMEEIWGNIRRKKQLIRFFLNRTLSYDLYLQISHINASKTIDQAFYRLKNTFPSYIFQQFKINPKIRYYTIDDYLDYIGFFGDSAIQNLRILEDVNNISPKIQNMNRDKGIFLINKKKLPF